MNDGAKPRFHVLYVIDSVMTPGGAEQSLALLAPEYRRLGVRLDVATIYDRPGHQEVLRGAGAELFALGGRGGRLGNAARARSLIRERRPDLVHTTLFEADVVGRTAARSTGTPVVTSLVNVSYGPEHYADPNVARWRLRAAQQVDILTARWAVRMHAVSQRVAEVMADRLRYPRDRIDVVHRGRSAQELGTRAPTRRTAARTALGASDADVVIVAVAREEHQKGLDVLLEAMPDLIPRVPQARLYVAARSGAESERLRDIVARRELERVVHFLGPRSDVADLLCAADVFVLPSRREGLPGAVIEAMALEVPIVASDLPEVREVVDETTALLVASDRPARLAAALIESVCEADAAWLRARAARQRFLEAFTIETSAARMVAFYERALRDVRTGD
jgi:glycosyltransferase involved in cell wall biosynthesis